ncbi:hypothetical protein [Streptomyces nigrescens]|uniref:hypothetical protein n=1 Tax=Streptomyces nigrescens TaxID=1920 RepID=UPI0036F638B6
MHHDWGQRGGHVLSLPNAVAYARDPAEPAHPDDKLWLLDGDEGFWPGLAEMSAGYHLNPIVMGANSRHTTL